MKGGEIDFEECNRLVDAFMAAFDTAKGYLGGKSEVALKYLASMGASYASVHRIIVPGKGRHPGILKSMGLG